MIRKKVNTIASKLSELPSIVRSVVLIGSHSANNDSSYSDIDILILTHADISPENASIIGNKISEAQENEGQNVFFDFYNPVCERCKLISSTPHRFHFITHPWDNIMKWINEKDFIACMWSQKSTVLCGENPFNQSIVPELNKSILDSLDGIPSFLREINNILIAKSPEDDAYEYKRYCKFFMDRIAEITNSFPEIIAKCNRPPLHPEGRNGLIQLSKYFNSIQTEINNELIKSSNKGIKSDK